MGIKRWTQDRINDQIRGLLANRAIAVTDDSRYPQLFEPYQSMVEKFGITHPPKLYVMEEDSDDLPDLKDFGIGKDAATFLEEFTQLMKKPMVGPFAVPGLDVIVVPESFAHGRSEKEISCYLGHELGHCLADHRSSNVKNEREADAIGTVLAGSHRGTESVVKESVRQLQRMDHATRVSPNDSFLAAGVKRIANRGIKREQWKKYGHPLERVAHLRDMGRKIDDPETRSWVDKLVEDYNVRKAEAAEKAR